MALDVGDRRIHPLTAEQVLRMVDAGILSEDDRVELLRGVLTEVSAKSPEHETVKLRVNVWLAAGAATGGYEVRVEGPIVVPDRTSLPEPDIAVVVVGGDPRRHPTTALLVIEVAASSLATDTRVKPALFAAAAVPEMWVVDVDARHVILFAEPSGDRYLSRTTVERDGVLRPRHVDVPTLEVAALLAGL